MEEPKKRLLHRSTAQSMIAGVCGGIAEYFDVDPIIVRAVFILLVFMNGVGIVLYLILWIVLPVNDSGSMNPQQRMHEAIDEMKKKAQSVVGSVQETSASSDRSQTFAVILVLLGFFFLLRNFGVRFNFFAHRDFLPLLLIVIGIALFYRKR